MFALQLWEMKIGRLITIAGLPEETVRTDSDILRMLDDPKDVDPDQIDMVTGDPTPEPDEVFLFRHIEPDGGLAFVRSFNPAEVR